MEFDGESLDMLEDMDVPDVANPLDDSNIILDLNPDGGDDSYLKGPDDEGDDDDETNNNNNNNTSSKNPKKRSAADMQEEEEEEDDEEDDDDDEDEDDDGYNERSTVASNNGEDRMTEDGYLYDGESTKGSVGSRRGRGEKSNAKAVECLDLDGNVIEVFKSGLSASLKLNIPQSDISQCCRGLKRSVSGYRFRFVGDNEDRSEFKLKRGYGYVLEPVPNTNSTNNNGNDNQAGNLLSANESKDLSSSFQPTQSTRNTRASRGEYSLGSQQAQERNELKLLASIRTRKWNQQEVDIGPFTIKKWLPNQSHPTTILQEMKRNTDVKKNNRRITKGRTLPPTGTFIRTRGTVNYLNSVLGENYEE